MAASERIVEEMVDNISPIPDHNLTHHHLVINTEEKAKVVAAVWGTDIIKFLAALAIVH